MRKREADRRKKGTQMTRDYYDLRGYNFLCGSNKKKGGRFPGILVVMSYDKKYCKTPGTIYKTS
jgi:hypothetical protein